MAKKPENKTIKISKKRTPQTKNIVKVIANIEEKQLMEWLTITGKANELKEPEKLQFLNIAKAYNLNPFKNEIFCTVYNKDNPEKRTLSIVIGYRAFIKRAEKVHILDGWSCTTLTEDDDLKAICTIYRKDWKFPFVHEAWYKECVQMKYSKNGSYPTSFWKKMPKFMLKKVCTAQAFRLCFPDEDMPYIQEENNIEREYEDPITIGSNRCNLEIEKGDDEKQLKKTNMVNNKNKLVDFVNKNQKQIMEKNIMPSSLFEEAKGKNDQEIDEIIKRVKEQL